MTTWNRTGLIKLGRALKQRGYDFVPPSVAEIKRYRRGDKRSEDALDNLLGWGVPVARKHIDAPLIALLQEAGVVHFDEERLSLPSMRAAAFAGEVAFHTSGPNAAVDAVFLGPDTYRFIDGIGRLLENRSAPKKVFEVGSGSGAASVALSKRYPAAHVIGFDINPDAISLASVNAAMSMCTNLGFRLSDVLSSADGDADLIICNPPFIADSQGRTYRDGGAMLGMELPLRILREAGHHLAPDGAILMYTASPVIDGQHVIAQSLTDLYPDAVLSELEDSIFDDLLDLPAYENVQRVAAVMIAVERARSCKPSRNNPPGRTLSTACEQ